MLYTEIKFCENPSLLFNTTCITPYYNPLAFPMYEQYCSILGKQLIHIESQEKLYALKAVMSIQTEMWIGIRGTGDSTSFQNFFWKAKDSSAVYPIFTNWGDFQKLKSVSPQSGNCATIDSQTLLWTNRRCHSWYPFLCEQGKHVQ